LLSILIKKNEYKALYLSIESARTAVNDIRRAVEIILEQFRDKIRFFLPDEDVAIEYLETIIQKKNYTETSI